MQPSFQKDPVRTVPAGPYPQRFQMVPLEWFGTVSTVPTDPMEGRFNGSTGFIWNRRKPSGSSGTIEMLSNGSTGSTWLSMVANGCSGTIETPLHWICWNRRNGSKPFQCKRLEPFGTVGEGSSWNSSHWILLECRLHGTIHPC